MQGARTSPAGFITLAEIESTPVAFLYALYILTPQTQRTHQMLIHELHYIQIYAGSVVRVSA